MLKQVGDGGAPFSAISGMALERDGKIVLAGNASDGQGGTGFLVVRLNADGSLDNSFGTGGKVLTQLDAGGSSPADAVAFEPDGRIVVGGFAVDGAGDHELALVRLNATDGSFDQSFGTKGKLLKQLGAGEFPSSAVDALAVQPDGDIVVAGSASDADGNDQFMVARLKAKDGALDSSFADGGELATQLGAGSLPQSLATALALQSDGKIVAGGDASDDQDNRQFAIVRLRVNGAFDSSFGGGGKVLDQLMPSVGEPVNGPWSAVASLALQPDGKIVAGGMGAIPARHEIKLAAARLNAADGGFDPSFGAGGKVIDDNGSIGALAVQPNARIVGAGIELGAMESTQPLVARLDAATGGLDPGFGGGGLAAPRAAAISSGVLNALVLQPDAGIVAGGFANDAGGNQLLFVVRLIGDLPPSADFTVPPGRRRVGQPLSFDGSAATDPDGTIGAYRWDFGDGQTASGRTVQHTYATPGRYGVTLTVSDDDGLSATGSKTVAVTAKPKARRSAPSVSHLRVSPRSFAAAGAGGAIARVTGATISYRDSQRATTTFIVRRPAHGVRQGSRCLKPRRGRRGRPCTRYIRIGGFRRRDRAGTNQFRFSGRIHRRKLRPGSYRLEAQPRRPGRSGRRTITRFRIVPAQSSNRA